MFSLWCDSEHRKERSNGNRKREKGNGSDVISNSWRQEERKKKRKTLLLEREKGEAVRLAICRTGLKDLQKPDVASLETRAARHRYCHAKRCSSGTKRMTPICLIRKQETYPYNVPPSASTTCMNMYKSETMKRIRCFLYLHFKRLVHLALTRDKSAVQRSAVRSSYEIPVLPVVQLRQQIVKKTCSV